ncbi:hypothetical protein BLNAU_10021 [Blattamonas nauphoetae]|uniref:Uncharacterized protein n=1 Tax=Blattamonas nauphoetae TaxID=2049346 RepID=A0ABQ9XUC8_9EUKA|nr:hypothetical protein BLNAU_10021 [Blattamonas nauphoetae]
MQPNLIISDCGFLFMHVASSFTSLMDQYSIADFSEMTGLPTDSVQATILDKAFRPLSPFITALWFRRFEIADDEKAEALPWLLAQMLITAPSHEPTLHFILSLPICHLFVGSLDLFTTDSIVPFFLDALREGVSEWRRGTDNVKARGAEILRLMGEEGLADKLEQTSFTTHKTSPFATSTEMTCILHKDLGLNYPRGERLPV